MVISAWVALVSDQRDGTRHAAGAIAVPRHLPWIGSKNHIFLFSRKY
jgi:hypothetical protein